MHSLHVGVIWQAGVGVYAVSWLARANSHSTGAPAYSVRSMRYKTERMVLRFWGSVNLKPGYSQRDGRSGFLPTVEILIQIHWFGGSHYFHRGVPKPR